MIEVRHLSKSFEDPDGREIPAVVNAGFSCIAGEIYGLLGPNGAGKTTTLRCLATILTPTSGTIHIAGHDAAEHPEAIRASIGFLTANAGLYGRLTPRETLQFFGGLHGLRGAALEQRVENALDLFDVRGFADRPNDRLSTGMRQRVGLARALVHDPPVVILDEPTSGLDPIVSRLVEETVVDLARRGKCVLLSTHSLTQAEEICGRMGLIAEGRVVAEGTAEELCAIAGSLSLRDAFFKLVRETQQATEAQEALDAV
jgi:sodium transport system ATP-binding protein